MLEGEDRAAPITNPVHPAELEPEALELPRSAMEEKPTTTPRMRVQWSFKSLQRVCEAERPGP